MADKKLAKPAVQVIKRFTIDKVTKFANSNKKNLAELLSVYPNYGVGFKVFYKDEKNEYYVIDRVIPKSSRNAIMYGILFKNGQMINRVQRIRYHLKENIWNYIPDSTCKTDNGLEYDIKETEELIKAKRQMFEERGKLFGLPSPIKAQKDEIKKKKAEAAKAPKKKF
jgi:hypothetical protein